MSQGQKRRFAKPEERARLAALSRTPEARKRQRQFCIELHQRPRFRTSLECDVAEYLDSLEMEYVEQYATKYHVWDFAILSARVFVEADECYWHGCEKCGHEGVKKTKELDKRKNTWARNHGWAIFRIKECSM